MFITKVSKKFTLHAGKTETFNSMGKSMHIIQGNEELII
jgi:hypothetical protein